MRVTYMQDEKGGTMATVYPERGSRVDRAGIAFGVGSAQCSKSDHFERVVGEGIALGRAIQDMGRQLEEYWESRSQTKVQVDARRVAQGRDPLYHTKKEAGLSEDNKSIEYIFELPDGTRVPVTTPTGPAGDAFLTFILSSRVGGKLSFEPKEE